MINDEVLTDILKPDFINNLIALMVTLNRHEARDVLGKALFHLSRIFHYHQQQKEYVAVSDECCFIEHYLFLQQLRYGSRLRFNITVGNSGNKKYIKCYQLFRAVETIISRLTETSEAPGLLSISFNTAESSELTVSYISDEYNIRMIL